MLKRSVKYSVIAVTLVVAMAAQPLRPAGIVTGLAALLPGIADVSSASAQGTTGCYLIYLPLIARQPSGSAASTANPTSAPASLANLTPGPEFAIISPQEGWTVSGMLYFAAQPLNSTGVNSVTFKAGSTDLGTDSTPQDGFKVFLNASALPAGPLQLTATASGPCGQLTRTATVNVVPTPPQSATVGSQGGVLASQIGSIITVPPGGVPDGTTITVTEKTQAETTAEHGIDWDALGVTFLGAQEVQSSAVFSKPLGVASAGFGNRVQPGQVVVNYMIAPDADGDGVDELVVVNTASVAPNNDVISDPVPQIMLESAATTSSSSSASLRTSSDGISGQPGTIINITGGGFNPASIYGNVAVWKSLVDGQMFETIGVVKISNSPDGSQQIFSAVIPPLSPGTAELTLLNKSTGSSAGPVSLNIEPPSPLSAPPEKIIDDWFASVITFTQNLTTTPDGDMFKNEAVDAFAHARAEFNELVQTGIPPELEEALSDVALMIENSGEFNVQSRQGLSSFIIQGTPTPTERMESFLNILGGVCGILAGLSVPFPAVAPAAGGCVFGWGQVYTIWYTCKLLEIDCGAFGPPPPSQTNSGRGPTGMGSAPPPGGNGAGNASGPPPGGCCSPIGAPIDEQPGRSKVSQIAGFFDQPPGRYVIKVLSGGSAIPFSGLTDAGGYFFVPFIPQGEPFTAVAIDTLTGQFRTFEGIGPATGESVFMFFDFLSEDGTVGTISWDGGGDGVSWHDPLNWSTDTLPTITDTVTINVPGNITVTHSLSATSIISLHSQEAIVLSGGSLSIDLASEINNTFTLSGGTLDGAGTITSTGTLTWTGGTMSGLGRTIANGGLVISGGVTKLLSGRTLDSPGTATWSSTGPLNLRFGAAFNNLPGATFDVQNDALFFSSGTAVSEFNNNGVVNVQTGTLSLAVNGGTSAGSFNVAAGAALNFSSGTHTLDGSASITSSGTVSFTSGTVNFNGTHTIAGTAALSGGGTISGTGTLTVTGLLTWTSGTMSGSGRTIANGELNISGISDKFLSGRTLDNAGAATWSDTGNIWGSGGSGGVINNLPGATFEVRNDTAFIGFNATFNNAGTLIKSAGTGTTQIDGVFNNSGTVDVQSGTLQLRNGGTSSGTFEGAEGTTLNFSRGTHTLEASASVSFPDVIFSGGTVNLAGTYTVSGSTSVTGGTANFNPGATVSNVGSSLTINAGTANFNSGDPITTTTVVLSGGGTLTGTSDIISTGVISWTGGTMSGSGKTIANGALEIGSLPGSGGKSLNARTLENNGAATWSAGDIFGFSAATLINSPSGSFNIATDDDLFYHSGGRPSFTNEGIVTKSSGSGSTSISFAFNNNGTVNVVSGTLSLDGGGNSAGAFGVQAGAAQGFRSTIYNLEAGSSVTGTGAVQISVGTVNISGTYSLTGITEVTGGTANFAVDAGTGALNLSGGTLTGNGTLTATGLITWTGSTMSGSGRTVANGGLTISGGGIKFLAGRALDNAGAATWTTGAGSLSLSGGAVFNNLLGATFDVQNDTSLFGGTFGMFNNAGAFIKSAGAGTNFVGVPFTNTGTVTGQTGALNFSSGYTQITGTTSLSGGNIAASGVLKIQGGSLSGAGIVTATVAITGQVNPGGVGASGVITITGNYAQAPAGTLNIELGGLTAGTQYDQLKISSTATLSGTLDVSLIGGFAPGSGNSFQVMTYGSRTGLFAIIDGHGQNYTANYNANDLTLVAQ